MTPPGDGGDEPPDPADPPRDASDGPPDHDAVPTDSDDGPTDSDDGPTDSDDRSATSGGESPDSGSDSNERATGDRSAGVTDDGSSSPVSTADAGRRRASNGGEYSAGTADDDRDGDAMDWTTFAYDIVSSAVAVLLVGALLFAISGVWPPMVAVESPSMTPHMQTGDLVFVMEEERFPGAGAHGDTGVVTAQTGGNASVEYRKFQRQGDVIVYRPRGANDTTPIIHRAMFWVESDENWYDEADRQAVGRYSECGETPEDAMPNCPAPHAGFITKGDANSHYDQVERMSGPVKPAWVVGTAEVRIPKLGCVRLRQEGCLTLSTGAGDPLAAVSRGSLPSAAGAPGATSRPATSNATATAT